MTEEKTFDPKRANETAQRIRSGTAPRSVYICEQPPTRLEQLRERRDSWYKIDSPGWLVKEKNKVLPEIIREIQRLENGGNNEGTGR